MHNPIIERELIGLLRTRKALFLQLGMATAFAGLILLRWPTDARVDLSGSQSRQVFQVFGYGLLTALLMLVPVFPATSIVREKNKGTLALLLNSPMKPWSIYFGKLLGVLGIVLLMLMMSLPAAAACFAMGGISPKDILMLYAVLAVAAVQFTALGLVISTHANSTDSALRLTYGFVLLVSVVILGPHLFLQGQQGWTPMLADWLRCLSPVSAVMEILGHGDVASQGLVAETGMAQRYLVVATVFTLALMIHTISQLNFSIFDRSRSQGVITDDRKTAMRWFRRLVFLVDPQRRKTGIGPLTNPIMVKEFRCRRFGRSHWMIRLVAGCALVSLVLTYATTSGTMDWGVETIGGIMVILQVALIVLLTPSLASGLISAERESGGWALLQMTPLSVGVILRGKLMSVVWTLALILCATLPGYLVMIYIEPALTQQVGRVLFCLLLTAALATTLSAAVSSLFRRTAQSTTTAYGLLVGLCAGTMLFWLGRDSRFGHSTVEAILTVNPMAAALNVIETPGFKHYNLVPANWWIMGGAIAACLVVLGIQTWRLTRPQ
jgi:ABC-type transport system involved in multi-copper enzyme maturation permease subunit